MSIEKMSCRGCDASLFSGEYCCRCREEIDALRAWSAEHRPLPLWWYWAAGLSLLATIAGWLLT